MTSLDSAEASPALEHDEYTKVRSSKFKFKSKRSRNDDADDSARRRKHRSDEEGHRRHRHHHRSKRRKYSPTGVTDDPSAYDDTYDANLRSEQYMDPDRAFRESLFDALADDEGAAYWEGVYGQPIHTYPDTYQTPAGELERMTEEEYAEYVRARMWEKTHQHIIEEREERERRRKEEKMWREKTRKMERDRGSFQRSVEESLKRGEERKAKRRWKEIWAKYTEGWEAVVADQPSEDRSVKDLLPWPVESGRVKDVSKEEVENFFRNIPLPEEGMSAILKSERVRWHPDKIQQRFAERGIGEGTMKAVTAVFQVIDRMWSEMREKKAKG